MYDAGCTDHVTRFDAVDTDSGVGPFDSKRATKVTDGSLGSVVWCLRLGNVDDGARHAANEDHGALSLTLHKVAGNSGCEEVSAINVDTPELLDAVVWVVDCVEVFGKASRSDQAVNLSVFGDDFLNDMRDGVRVGDITIVASHKRNPLTVSKENGYVVFKMLTSRHQGSRP